MEDEEVVIGYVTVEYANEYIQKHFLSTDAARLAWEALEDESDKEVLLQISFEAIESVPYSGHKTFEDQTTVFPRCPEEEVPVAVKMAQVENAVYFADDSAAEDANLYSRLKQFGISYYRIGNLSEQFGSAASTFGTTLSNYGIVSPKAARLLRPYMAGSFNIRGRWQL